MAAYSQSTTRWIQVRRQYPIGKYIVDFYCADCKLAIEVDGDSHDEQVEYDEKRTKELKENGYRIIRFTNRQVLRELENVLEAILYECEKLRDTPSPDPHPSPLPKRERELR